MRGRDLFLVLGTLLSVASPSTARVLVRGVVTDANGRALPGASIYLRGTRLLAVSDAQGQFTLDGEHDGDATLVTTLSGFRAFETTLTLGAEPVELSIHTRARRLQRERHGAREAARTGAAGPFPYRHARHLPHRGGRTPIRCSRRRCFPGW